MISIRHEVFFAVADHLSFSKAGQILNISQPAVSKHVKALEQYYKTSLIDRKGAVLQLSEAGKLLYNSLIEAKRIQNKIEFQISTLKDQFKAKGQLKLGASTTVALYILPKILSNFHKQFPEIQILLLNRNSETILHALIEKEIDIGIIEAKNKKPSILYDPFLADEVIGVCAADSPLAKKGTIRIKQITQVPIALREQGSGTLAALKQILSKQQIKITDLNVKVHLGGTEALKNFLKADDCLGFLPKRSVLRELRDNELVEVNIEGLKIQRNFFFIQRPDNDPESLANMFYKFAKGFYNI